ncbi:MAG: peptidylprolyl isomerase [Bacteroidetes bacterium HGW-Bacteroidetes-12]|nr:MAG: peptidylprolyl isomerase [Bacteroidetes bacterium HGW-Bacteroidetes-12]
MKKIALSAVAVVILFACNNESNSSKTIALTNNIDSVSYAIGINSANGLKTNVPEINMDAYLQGFKDQKDSLSLSISTEDVDAILQAYSMKRQQQQMEEQQKQQEAQFGNVKEEGIKFLEQNKSQPGVQVTASGLQYKVVKEGKGKNPAATSVVKVHYHGTTPDGTVFDSSVERGEPIEFGLNQVIPGWTEGVQLMKEGAKYIFYIPQELAYGANAPQGGQGPIKPYMPLVFEVELIKVNN